MTKLRARDQEAFGRHGAGWVTTFSVTQSRPHVGQSEAPPARLEWAYMEKWVLE